MIDEISEELVLMAIDLSRENALALSLVSQMIYFLASDGDRSDLRQLTERLCQWDALIPEDIDGTKHRFRSLIESTAYSWAKRP